jgi:Na+/phosphate symporter
MADLNYDLLKMYERMRQILKDDREAHITKIWETEDMIDSIERRIKAEQSDS